MIRGIVNGRREGIISVRLRGPGGATRHVDAIVDTGFTASITLPQPVISALGLIRRSGGQAVLGDGSVKQFDLFRAEIEWDGRWREVTVSAVGRQPLVGMRLLDAHILRIEVRSGGTVEIAPMP